ncbi:hypothetical protein F442_18288 [Phytophthora nicotianae P10297]|uniref:DDE-1 domain-containing protein n=2 Tax=Phytophthora nicotianae TaxID=4792 RepID=W2YDJ8_PHYNI|nr:hypothetical protein F444_18465 [Phytophthora nicotianae P1976]ETP33140.1 hypothetical protein F442_18288 [Phytophthora nicotianae P10297]
MAVVSGGLAPYLQAGDVGIFKSFKDKISVFINEWKRSVQVSYSRGGNPRTLSIAVVVSWVTTAWRQITDSIVQQSVGKCGFFANPSDWYISKHDVYGSQFNAAWNARSDVGSDSDIEDDTNSSFDDVLDTLVEIVIDE